MNEEKYKNNSKDEKKGDADKRDRSSSDDTHTNTPDSQQTK